MDGIENKCFIKEEGTIKEEAFIKEELDLDDCGSTQEEETNRVINSGSRIDLRKNPENERRARNSGKAYISRQGHLVPAKTVKNLCTGSSKQPCQLVCAQRLIPERKREKIFQYFWNLPDRFKKYEFICRHVRLIQPKRRKPNPSSSKIRNYSRFYFLPLCGKLIRVCRTTFTATLDINEQWLSTALKKFGHLSSGLQLQEENDLQLESVDQNTMEEFETKFVVDEPDPLDIKQTGDPDKDVFDRDESSIMHLRSRSLAEMEGIFNPREVVFDNEESDSNSDADHVEMQESSETDEDAADDFFEEFEDDGILNEAESSIPAVAESGKQRGPGRPATIFREMDGIFNPREVDFGNEESDSDLDVDHLETRESPKTDEDSADDFLDQSEDNGMLNEAESPTPAVAESEKSRAPGRPATILRGKNNFKWSTQAPEIRGRPSDITNHLPGAKGEAQFVASPIEAWSLLVTDEMLSAVVLCTNEKIHRQLEKLKTRIEKEGQTFKKESYHRNTNLLEIKGLIGLLYYAGLNKCNNINADRLWSQFGLPMFRGAMSENRFLFLLCTLRFDDKSTRDERKRNDKFAPIREIWQSFIENCQYFYTPHQYCTVGEQLLSFRGRCAFRIYMRAKPDKYGIKFVMINDAKTFYMFNAIPYAGKFNTKNHESVPSYYVRKLSKPIRGTNRNITCNKWFTSYSLVDRMRKEYALTVVGTIRNSKREIPQNLLSCKNVGESKFAYHDEKTLVAYAPKQNKIVLILSSLHRSGKIHERTGKPEIIMFYNSTKGGTETFDHLCHEYTTARKTKTWPLRVWYGMLDQAGINALVLYTLNANNDKLKRDAFLESLSFDLVKPLLVERYSIKALRISIKMIIKSLLSLPEDDRTCITVVDNKLPKRVRCAVCSAKSDRKTWYKCMGCNLPMCAEHTSKLCCVCAPCD